MNLRVDQILLVSGARADRTRLASHEQARRRERSC